MVAIAKNYDGGVKFSVKPSKGSTFTIELPFNNLVDASIQSSGFLIYINNLDIYD